jgi:hypothetical protein
MLANLASRLAGKVAFVLNTSNMYHRQLKTQMLVFRLNIVDLSKL